MNRTLISYFLRVLGVPKMIKDTLGNISLVTQDGVSTKIGKGAPGTLTVSRALTDADNNCVLTYSGSGAIAVTVPVGLVDGFGCKLVQKGAGAVTVTAGASTTVANVSSFVKTAGANSVLEIVQATANNYVLAGAGAVA